MAERNKQRVGLFAAGPGLLAQQISNGPGASPSKAEAATTFRKESSSTLVVYLSLASQILPSLLFPFL